MVVVLRGTILVVGRVARSIPVVVTAGFFGTVHFGSLFAGVFANYLCVESDEDSNQQDPWQEITHVEA